MVEIKEIKGSKSAKELIAREVSTFIFASPNLLHLPDLHSNQITTTVASFYSHLLPVNRGFFDSSCALPTRESSLSERS